MFLESEDFQFLGFLISILAHAVPHFGPKWLEANLAVGSRWPKKTPKLPKMAQDGPQVCKNDKNLHLFENFDKKHKFFHVFGTQGRPKSDKIAPKMAQHGFQDLKNEITNSKFVVYYWFFSWVSFVSTFRPWA